MQPRNSPYEWYKFGGKVSFYQELWSSITPNSTCAWLEQGLYVAADGTACSCCFIKNSTRDGLGVLATVPVEEVLRKRGELQGLLQAGQMPDQCQGCGIAHVLTGLAAAS